MQLISLWGSNECACGVPFPDSAEDVSMESGTDKRSRESPDSTLKPEGKSLKTSEPTTVQTTMDTDEVSTAESVKPSNVTKRPKTVSEVESLMQEVHSRMPAWKATKILETRKASQVDLAALGEATGILFESQDMLSKAVLYLDRLRKKKLMRKMPTWMRLGRLTLTLLNHRIKIRMRTHGPTTRRRVVQALRLLGTQRFPMHPTTVKALTAKDRRHPLRHQLTLVDSKGRQHPNLAQLLKIGRSPRLSLIKSGLVVSLKGVRMC